MVILLCLCIISINFKYAIQNASKKRNPESQSAMAGVLSLSSSTALLSSATAGSETSGLLSSDQRSRLLPSRSLAKPNQQQNSPFGDSGGGPADLSNAIRKGERKAPRTLIGIISSDSFNDCTYRKRHRAMFEIWNDTRVCSLDQVAPECQVVYTFILGAGNSSAPTQLVNDSWPLLVDKPISTKHDDVNAPDTSLLNIRYVMFCHVLYI